MRIPVGEFGLRPPGEAGSPRVQPGAFVQEGLTATGEGGLKIGAAMATEAVNEAQLQAGERREAQVEARRVDRESKRAEAMTIHAQAANALGDAHDKITLGLADGTISKDDAPRLWQEQAQQIAETHIARVDKANAELVRASIEGNIGTFGRQINHAVVKRGQQDIGVQLNSTLEELQRSAQRDLPNAVQQAEMALDSLGPQAGLNVEQIGKAKQAFREGATFNKLNNELVTSRGNYRALGALQKTIAENGDLDPGKKNALLNSAQSQMLHLQNVAEAAQRRREAAAVRAINVIEKTTAMGVPIDAKTWVATQGAVKGTEYEPLVQGLMQAERETQALLSKPIAEQVAAVNAAEARALSGEGGLAAKVNADRLRKTIGNNVTMLTQTPLVYAVQRQGADGTPLDLQNLGSWNDILATRLAAVDPLAKQFNVGKRLLYPEEARSLAGVLQGSSSQQATQVFNTLRRAIPDDKAYRDTIAQIAPDDPVTAYAGGLMGKTKAAVREGWISTSSAPDPQIVARTLLDGRRILAPTKAEKGEDGNRRGMFKMPADKEFDAEFESATRGIYAGNPEARSIDYQAVRAYYAGRASEQGKFDGQLDSSVMREGVTAVLGGISDRYGRVVRPYGWAEDQFRDEVQKSWRAAVQFNNLPVQMKDARIKLRNGKREGEYYVMDGSTFLQDTKGNPLTIHVMGGGE